MNLLVAAVVTELKVREPIIRWTQWARTFKVSSETGKWAIGNLSGGDWALGQSPMRSPSVFNFFRPGYVPPHTAIAWSVGRPLAEKLVSVREVSTKESIFL